MTLDQTRERLQDNSEMADNMNAFDIFFMKELDSNPGWYELSAKYDICFLICIL